MPAAFEKPVCSRRDSFDLALAMISAPRPQPTWERSLAELRRGGFHQTVHIFQEPATGIRPGLGIVVHSNRRRLGIWRNWLQAAKHLLERTNASLLMICEDDLAMCPTAAAALKQGLAKIPSGRFGVASLYTPLHNVGEGPVTLGWQTTTIGRTTWGATVYCFSRRSLTEILSSAPVRNTGAFGHTDSIIGAACVAIGRKMFSHLPSLVDHTGGGNSTSGHLHSLDSMAVGFDPQLTSAALRRAQVENAKPLARRARGLRRALPLVSCIMPTGGRPEFAVRAVEYFRRQDWPRRELIVVDDGTPGLRQLVAGDARIKYVRPSERLTTGVKRNLACHQATGELVVQWDDDDWHGPARIRRQVEPLLANEADITGMTEFLVWELGTGRLWQVSAKAARRHLFERMMCGTLVFRRGLFDRLARYPNMSLGEDVGFVKSARLIGARILPTKGGRDFVYIRHSANTWQTCPWYRTLGSTRVRLPPWPREDDRFYRLQISTGGRPVL
jgi:hypothetical protein